MTMRWPTVFACLKNQGMTKEHRYWHPVGRLQLPDDQRTSGDRAGAGRAIRPISRAAPRGGRMVPRGTRRRPGPALAGGARLGAACVVAVRGHRGGRLRLQAGCGAGGATGVRASTRVASITRCTSCRFTRTTSSGAFPVADDLASRGICLPTWSGLQREDVHFVCEQLKRCGSRLIGDKREHVGHFKYRRCNSRRRAGHSPAQRRIRTGQKF